MHSYSVPGAETTRAAGKYFRVLRTNPPWLHLPSIEEKNILEIFQTKAFLNTIQKPEPWKSGIIPECCMQANMSLQINLCTGYVWGYTPIRMDRFLDICKDTV